MHADLIDQLLEPAHGGGGLRMAGGQVGRGQTERRVTHEAEV